MSTSLIPGISGLELEQRLPLLPWARIQLSVDSEQPCLTHPGAGLSLSKGKTRIKLCHKALATIWSWERGGGQP